jgi:MinD-like ATPase involved in chromosome partitioning or flagellar assembly
VTVITVGSWRGLGASTTALLLASAAATRGHESWLVEADPAGGVLASRAPALAGVDSLGRVAFMPSDEPVVATLQASARRLGSVSVVTGPWDSFQAWSAIASPRRLWADALRRLGDVVVVDVGSMRGGHVPSWPIIERSDLLVMVTNPDAAALTATAAWMDAKGQAAPGVAGLSLDTARLVVVDTPGGSTERFGPAVADELDGRLAGWWDWEPRVVDHVLRSGSLDHRSVRRHDLTHTAVSTLEVLLAGTVT